MTATPPTPTVRVVEHSAELPRADWDALCGPRDVFLTCSWLDVVERTAGVPMAYLTAERDGKVVAGLATALVSADVPWALGKADVVLDRSVAEGLPAAAELRERLPSDLTAAIMPSMAMGGRHVGTTRMLLAPEATSADVDALLATAEDLARRAGMRSVGMLYVDETETVLAERLHARGYLDGVTGSFSTLTLPAGGFDGYLRSLPSKRRISVGAERRRIREAGVEVRRLSLAEVDLDRLATLEAALLEKYDITARPAQLRPLLQETGDVFGADAFVMTLSAEGELRGFVLVLGRGRHWLARQTGYDYDYQRRTRLPLYFEVVYYALIEAAGAAGVEAIHYGLGSVEAKRSRGCTTSEQRLHLLPLAGP